MLPTGSIFSSHHRGIWRTCVARVARVAVVISLVGLAGAVRAQVPPTPAAALPATLPPVVVTATRTEAASFDVPASIDRVGAETIRGDGRALVNISESLGGVPGLLARDRQNYAQDVQISVRGFGARSTFGIRGVRLYVDGIPATLPDGQGQISNVDLGSADRIEVLRGPFSALYGNSSGGVVQVFTEEPSASPNLSFDLATGSDGLRRVGSKFSGTSAGSSHDGDGALGIVASVSDFRTDGYRDHSQAHRQLGNLKLRWRPDAASTLTLIANSVALPTAQDPLGLSRAQFDANPRGVDPAALAFDTRKSVDQTQGGLIYERRVDAANALRVLVYRGHRGTVQFQSIPVATQLNPLNPGGVIDLGRDYRGGDLRWTWKTTGPDRPFSLVAGLAYDALTEQRGGYRNFIDTGGGGNAGRLLGVQGALRRDETNDVANFDQYLQAAWQFTPKWTLNAGVRHSQVRFSSSDHYIVGPNPDDSGNARYGATLPVLGLLYALSAEWHLYATAGRGFETPTLNELAYRPNGATGLNLGLQAARSDSVEVGAKARLADFGEFTAAVFQTGTEHEIVTLSNLGGRSTFQNAGATRRRGLELGWSATLVASLRAQAAYTLLDARYRDAFATCVSTPCALPNQTIPAGNRIPGTARSALFTSLGWAPTQGWRAGAEARWLSRVYVNDANSDAAQGYATVGANLGYLLRRGAWNLTGYVRGDNLFDRRYAGSVIVNEGNGRFFEPAPGRTWLASLSVGVDF